jgi:hypothetical protein
MRELQLNPDAAYQALVERISAAYAHGQLQAHRAVNEHLTRTFWQIGHDIVEYEQGGQTRAAYGQSLLANLSRDLRLRHGKGFSRSNVIRARQFYLAYPKGATLSHLLSWSHVVELLKLDDPLERGFYEQQCAREKWSVRELQRQIKSSLFLRLAASREKSEVLKLATKGNIVSQPDDLLRNNLFVSRYAVELPKKTEMERFLKQVGKEVGR